jgi:serine/threonine protein kinase
LESIRLEIQILSECNHPNIVQFMGSYVFDDILWINLEYCRNVVVHPHQSNFCPGFVRADLLPTS